MLIVHDLLIGKRIYQEGVYIGLTDDSDEGNWRWVEDGLRAIFTKWFSDDILVDAQVCDRVPDCLGSYPRDEVSCQKQRFTSCSAYYDTGFRNEGVYNIYTDNSAAPVEVECKFEGGYSTTVIHHDTEYERVNTGYEGFASYEHSITFSGQRVSYEYDEAEGDPHCLCRFQLYGGCDYLDDDHIPTCGSMADDLQEAFDGGLLRDKEILPVKGLTLSDTGNDDEYVVFRVHPILCYRGKYECRGMYHCLRSNTCLSMSSVCDGVAQCPNNDDEADCELECPDHCQCQSDMVKCQDSRLKDIPMVGNNTRFLDLRLNDLMKSNVLRSFLWIIGLAAVVCNMISITYHIYTKRKTVNSELTKHLAIVDLLFGLFMLSIACLDLYYKGRYVENAEEWKESILCKATGLKNNKESIIARKMFLGVVTNFCCWFPINVMGLLAIACVDIPGDVYAWSIVFILPINSAINPILYTISNMKSTTSGQTLLNRHTTRSPCSLLISGDNQTESKESLKTIIQAKKCLDIKFILSITKKLALVLDQIHKSKFAVTLIDLNTIVFLPGTNGQMCNI
ncbi:hypothetical protein CAPTEDRAFT_197256 [Capitella teleta]|uniref:G-protein coupled receptors family 1 profile domain-containing protein n=1 Tax=Capitella teleta TaxID=283909 RepID=R7V6L3_CAPTE|nr:hypothetical protein CAPTEDRAFT_197256 [Capitella teleta]|eukprot:ELU14102.1 hypothetical protein CAPTEDRAFT_197256 [Capitella teleta]